MPFLLSTLLAMTTSFIPADSSEAYLEIVTYTVTDTVDFDHRVRKAYQLLSTSTPPRWWTHWQSTDGQTRADVVAWPDKTAALAAAERVATDPNLAFFTTAIDTVNHFGHYRTSVVADDLLTALRSDGLLELALFSSSAPATTAELHPIVHGTLTQTDGLIKHVPLRQEDSATGFGDLAMWRSAELQATAATTLPTHPELSGYFSSIAELSVYTLFTRRLLLR